MADKKSDKENDVFNKFISELEIKKVVKDPDADPNCHWCHGTGYCTYFGCDDYEEYSMTGECGCKHIRKREKEEREKKERERAKNECKMVNRKL